MPNASILISSSSWEHQAFSGKSNKSQSPGAGGLALACKVANWSSMCVKDKKTENKLSYEEQGS